MWRFGRLIRVQPILSPESRSGLRGHRRGCRDHGVRHVQRPQQNGFVFGTTPAGIEYDGQVAAQGSGGGFFLRAAAGTRAGVFRPVPAEGFNKNWDGSWTVASSGMTKAGIPSFAFPLVRSDTVRVPILGGFNVYSPCPPAERRGFLGQRFPASFGSLPIGLCGRADGSYAAVPPLDDYYSVCPWFERARLPERRPDRVLHKRPRWAERSRCRSRRGLTLDLTVNTDFAQVEVDDQQVNLTRFSLLLSRKASFLSGRTPGSLVWEEGARIFSSVGASGSQAGSRGDQGRRPAFRKSRPA